MTPAGEKRSWQAGYCSSPIGVDVDKFFSDRGHSPKEYSTQNKGEKKRERESFCDQVLKKGTVFYLYHKSVLFYGLTMKP